MEYQNYIYLLQCFRQRLECFSLHSKRNLAPLGSVRLTLERFKPHSKRNLAPLGSIWGALATLKIVLPCRRELDFEGLKGHFWGTFFV